MRLMRRKILSSYFQAKGKFDFELTIKLLLSKNKQIDDKMKQEMTNMTLNELSILRNSIYASYGREFKTNWLQIIFDIQPWYKMGGFSEDKLTEIDRQNIKIIME